MSEPGPLHQAHRKRGRSVVDVVPAFLDRKAVTAGLTSVVLVVDHSTYIVVDGVELFVMYDGEDKKKRMKFSRI